MRGRLAALLLAGALVARGEDGVATTLRFEAAAPALDVQVDPSLGVLVQALTAERAWTRRGEGPLAAMAAGWSAREPAPTSFTTSDGRRWCLEDGADAGSLLQWVEGRWRPAEVAGPADALAARRELRRGAVRLGIVARVRADDGTDLLLDGFGAFVHREGRWTFAPLQRLAAPPIGWAQVAWRPGGEGVTVGAGGRALLGRAGRLDVAPAGPRPDPGRRYTRLRDGVWLVATEADVALVTSDGAERARTPLMRAHVLAYRRRDDAVLLQGALVGSSWVWAELGVETGALRVLERRGNQRDPRGAAVVDDAGALWSDDHAVLRRWDGHRLLEAPLAALLVGSDPRGRVWFVHGGVAFSIERAELERELERAPAQEEVVDDVQGAATLDADGHLRALRLVACDPPDEAGVAVHQRRAYRFHVRCRGAWVLDETSATYEERRCALRWCQACHGARREAAPRGGFETRPPGVLDPEGRVMGLDRDRRPHPDPRALLRRPDGSEWLLGPAGLIELARDADGRHHPRRLRLPGSGLAWVQDADGDVWQVEEGRLRKVTFPDD